MGSPPKCGGHFPVIEGQEERKQSGKEVEMGEGQVGRWQELRFLRIWENRICPFCTGGDSDLGLPDLLYRERDGSVIRGKMSLIHCSSSSTKYLQATMYLV